MLLWTQARPKWTNAQWKRVLWSLEIFQIAYGNSGCRIGQRRKAASRLLPALSSKSCLAHTVMQMKTFTTEKLQKKNKKQKKKKKL